MYITSIKIHNFRSIKDAYFPLQKYSLLVGENNAGKTNIITALRIFYEDVKYDFNNDFPKFKTNDKESWIEIIYTTTDDEQNNLKAEYRDKDKLLIVRKVLKSDTKDLVKSSQSNIYAYEGGTLSSNLFYGAKNISSAKLGKIIYIPELSKTDDNFKMSGPSPLREMINFVMGKVAKSSKSFGKLQKSFDEFNKNFKNESSDDGFSINELVKDVNKNIEQWGIDFGIYINPISSDEIIKNLLSHYIEDKQLEGKEININMFGQGLQRHLIYTLIRLSAKYVDKKEEKKKEFSPDFNLILFEEPEAFLHPYQQEVLNNSLVDVSEDPYQQILATTHSPIFVSRNIPDLLRLIRICKTDGVSKIYFVTQDDLNMIFDKNIGLYKIFNDLLIDKKTSSTMMKKIKEIGLAGENDDIEIIMEEESLKFSLWLDYDRSSAFFAKHVVICEGASEKVLLDYLLNTEWFELKNKHIYCLDAMGKFNIHRFMNIFNKFGIYHSVLYDKDNNDIHTIVNNFLLKNNNDFSVSTYALDPDFESFLQITKPKLRPDKKPLNIMWHLFNNKIDKNKISQLKVIMEKLTN